MATDTTHAHELDTLDTESNSIETARSEHVSSLPPTDGGWQAWLFLFASFLIEMLLWGESVDLCVSFLTSGAVVPNANAHPRICVRFSLFIWRAPGVLLTPRTNLVTPGWHLCCGYDV